MSDDEQSLSRKKKPKTSAKTLTKLARKILFSPPSQADENSHKWQCLFVEVERGVLPYNDKLDSTQKPIVNSDVVDKALKVAHGFASSFYLTGEKYTEENNRPCIYALAVGLNYFLGQDEVRMESGPVRYSIKRMVDGEECYVETSPPGEKSLLVSERVDHTLQHDDEPRKRWKSDLRIDSMVDVGGGKKECRMRILVEAKGEAVQPNDLYQVSLSGLKRTLTLCQASKPVEIRLYVEVWGTIKYMYGIQDIFGFVTVQNGTVTKESFQAYKKQLDERVQMKSFPVDSYNRIPKTLEELQRVYDEKAEEFALTYGCELPSKSGREDFLVGVVYLSWQARLMPVGDPVSVEASFLGKQVFVQGHLRILGSDSILTGDHVNERLLQNRQLSRAKRQQNPYGIQDEHGPKQDPEPVVYWREVSAATKNTIPVTNPKTGEISFLEPMNRPVASVSGTTGTMVVSKDASSLRMVR